MAIGSTTLVPSETRGKLGGLFNMAESLGRFLGPAGCAIGYAWSISPSGSSSAYGWVNHSFVFRASAIALALCAVLAWSTLTAENLMKRQDNVGVDDEDGGDLVSSAASPVYGRVDRSHPFASLNVANRDVDLV